jgi:AraC-like DNA-binding protein
MQQLSYKPPPPLDRFVEVIWTHQGEARPHPRERLLPDGSAELVVDLHRERFPIYASEGGDRHQTFRGSVICGPHSQFFVIDTTSEFDVAGVHFKPGGAYPFLKVPSGEIHNLHVGLEDLWGAAAGELRERLLEADSPRAKVRVLEEALLMRISGPPERHPAVAFALNEFHGTPEAHKISRVTERIGLSPRRFIDVFRKEVGLTPKLFCRVRRFQKVLRMISAGRTVDWVEVALACGYFDQAHFIHDFQAFSGINPSSYLVQHTSHFNHVPIRS